MIRLNKTVLLILCLLGAMLPACGVIPLDTPTPTVTIPDADQDGYTAAEGDCDDTDADIYPGAQEFCNGLDDDCSGYADDEYVFWTIDADGDGYQSSQVIPGTICDKPGPGYQHYTETAATDDCDDSDPSINIEGVENCDGLDNDCDGGIDEDFDYDGDGEPDDPSCF